MIPRSLALNSGECHPPWGVDGGICGGVESWSERPNQVRTAGPPGLADPRGCGLVVWCQESTGAEERDLILVSSGLDFIWGAPGLCRGLLCGIFPQFPMMTSI